MKKKLEIKVYGPQIKEFLHCVFDVPISRYWGTHRLVFSFECEYCNLVRLKEAACYFDVELEYKIL